MPLGCALAMPWLWPCAKVDVKVSELAFAARANKPRNVFSRDGKGRRGAARWQLETGGGCACVRSEDAIRLPVGLWIARLDDGG